MNIDFVEPLRPSRAAWIAAGSLWAIVLILAGVYGVLEKQLARHQEARKTAEMQARVPVAVSKPRVVPPYQEEALAALKRAAMPEAAAFTELERVAVAGIQLRSIDDNPSASIVTVELDATSDAVLIDYVDQLNAGMPAPAWQIRQTSALDSRAADAGSTKVEFTRSATIFRDF